MTRPITVSVIGGLGNQLFAFYAGFALAARHGIELVVDDTWFAHGVSLREFDLPCHWIRHHSGLAGALIGRRGIPFRAYMKAVRQSRLLSAQFRIYDSNVTGYDPNLLLQPAGSLVRGYFQSWEIVSEAVRLGAPRRPELRRTSPWLRDATALAQHERPVVLHVRRGDYSAGTFGLLSEAYYLRALDRVRDAGITGPLWIFSDEPGKVPASLLSQGRLMQSTAGPAEEMLLMSYGGAHIVANSTFSWWGAWMSGGQSPVIYPDPWLRHGPVIEGLIPPEWTPLPADWA